MSADGFGLTSYIVPPTPVCPVAGMVGVCNDCLGRAANGAFAGAEYYLPRNKAYRRWQPPPVEQPVRHGLFGQVGPGRLAL